MKKMISIAVAAALIATLSIPVFAAGTTTSTPKNPVTASLRAELKKDRADLIANREANEKIRVDDKNLRAELKADIATIKSEKIQLTADQLATLKSDNAQIKSIWEAIRTTKGSMDTLQQQNKDAVKNNDAATLEANFQQMYAIQNTRNQQLTQINGILQDMVKLLSDVIATAHTTSSTSSPV